MNEPVTIVIPGTPHGKGRPRFSARTRTTYTPSATRAYQETVGRMATIEMRGKDFLTGPLHMDMRAHFAVPPSWNKAKRNDALMGSVKPTGRPDVDNLIKAVADGLQGIVYQDDAAIVSVTCSKVYAAGEPFVVATVKPVSNRVPETPSEARDATADPQPMA